jgi:hypothetical protein
VKRKTISAVIVIFIIYCSGYIFLRQTRQEIWERDGKTYVIFPEDKILYYLYRPLSMIDEKITGIGFHIGQHR